MPRKQTLWPVTNGAENPLTQSKLPKTMCSQHEARENLRERVTIGFGFTSDWIIKWREIFQPIVNRGDVKPKQIRIPSNEHHSKRVLTLIVV